MNMNESGLGKLRVSRGLGRSGRLTQQYLADYLDVTVTHLCRIERGRVRPSSELASRMARRLGITTSRFWDLWGESRSESLRDEMKRNAS